MASHPLGAAVLLGFGIRDLSMEASAIPEIREAIARVTLADLERTTREALEQGTAAGSERVVSDAFREVFSDLLEAYL